MTKGLFDFDGIFGDLFNDVKLTKSSTAVETETKHTYRASANDKGLTLEVELPGCGPNDVELSLRGNVITVATKKVTGRYTVDAGFDLRTARARMVHGMLEVRIDRCADGGVTKIPIADK